MAEHNNSTFNNLVLEALSREALFITQQAALDTHEQIGQQDERMADKLATTSMRVNLNNLAIQGVVVCGEGERDKAPMLYHGEKLGKGGVSIDIAVDPLEGTTLCANNLPGSICVIAFAPPKGFLNVPDIYMEKLAIGFNFKERLIDLDNSIKVNLNNIAQAKGCSVKSLKVIILNRPRHEEMIARVKELGANVELIQDGDVMGIIALTKHFYLADVYMGIGGAPEGVLAAAALQNTGGQFCARLVASNDIERGRALSAGISDLGKQYYLNDLASTQSIFAATAVTQGNFINQIKITNGNFITHSLLIYNKNLHKIETIHQ